MSRRLLAVLLLVSVLTNIAFLARLRFPRAVEHAWLALHPVPAPRATDHVAGPAAALVVVIEYADFFCPFCAQLHPVLERLAEQGRIRWVYRHFPMLELHPRAGLAAEAAECAAGQGRFWPFAAGLYADHAALDTTGLRRYARLAELDTTAFDRCLRDQNRVATVERARREARELRLRATPTLYVNGKRFEGFASEAALLNAISRAERRN